MWSTENLPAKVPGVDYKGPNNIGDPQLLWATGAHDATVAASSTESRLRRRQSRLRRCRLSARAWFVFHFVMIERVRLVFAR